MSRSSCLLLSVVSMVLILSPGAWADPGANPGSSSPSVASSPAPAFSSYPKAKTDTALLGLRPLAEEVALNDFPCEVVNYKSMESTLKKFEGKMVEISWHLGVKDNRPALVIDAVKKSPSAPPNKPSVEFVMKDVKATLYGQVDKVEASANQALVVIQGVGCDIKPEKGLDAYLKKELQVGASRTVLLTVGWWGGHAIFEMVGVSPFPPPAESFREEIRNHIFNSLTSPGGR